MKKYEIKISFSVSQNWIDDGFDLKERIQQIIEFFTETLLPHAYEWETKCKVSVKELN